MSFLPVHGEVLLWWCCAFSCVSCPMAGAVHVPTSGTCACTRINDVYRHNAGGGGGRFFRGKDLHHQARRRKHLYLRLQDHHWSGLLLEAAENRRQVRGLAGADGFLFTHAPVDCGSRSCLLFPLLTCTFCDDMGCQLWDVAGHEKFGSCVRAYYRYSMGALLSFDLTRESTMHRVEDVSASPPPFLSPPLPSLFPLMRIRGPSSPSQWKKSINEHVSLLSGHPIPMILLANKVRPCMIPCLGSGLVFLANEYPFPLPSHARSATLRMRSTFRMRTSTNSRGSKGLLLGSRPQPRKIST